GANVVTTDNSDWATNCPEYKVTAVQVQKVLQPNSNWQSQWSDFHQQQQELLTAHQQDETDTAELLLNENH
uniref:hypothetical protein n=1 Tax=Paenalcaligenes sp. TaxID=1966342 RepID=UPI0026072455